MLLAITSGATAQSEASADTAPPVQQEPAQAAPVEDCITQAARYHGVNQWVLRAIGWHESKIRPGAIGRNTNGSVDLGAFQTNSVHLPELAKYGINAQDLMNGCVSAYVGAWRLRSMINKYGLSWNAVGAYHSETPQLRDRYAAAIQGILIQWGILRPDARAAPEVTLRTTAPAPTTRVRRPPAVADASADQMAYDATESK